jgi:microcystin-dependent protein
MTVAVNDRQSPGLGNGIITTFPFDFPVTVQGTVKVLVNQALVPTNAYTLDKVARTVTFNTAPANGAAISILGETPLAQLITSSRAGSTVNFSAVENQLDNIVNAQQELQYNINTVVAAATDAVTIATEAAADVEAAADAALASLDLLNDRYLGEKTSLPTLDNDGDPLVDGTIVSLTGQTPSSLNGMYVRRDGIWLPAVVADEGVFRSFRYVATAAQTTFSGPDANALTLTYVPGSVIVAVNGVIQSSNTFTATNGTSIVLGSGLSANDVVAIFTMNSFQVADTWTKAEANALYAAIGHVGAGGAAHAEATTSVAGFMSGTDKTKLDGLSAGLVGEITAYAGRAAPSGWLLCDGANVSRATFAGLFDVLCPTLGAVTITIASPGVVTLTAHNLRSGDRIRLSTTGALPTGLATGTDYFVNRIDANTFNLRTTAGGANINTSGTQSGVHTAVFFAFGAGDGSTTFTLPDLRGRVPVGGDAMGGTAAARMTSAGSGIFGEALGQSGGAQTHVLTVAQLAAHTHSGGLVFTGNGGFVPQGSDARENTNTGSTGTDAAHQNTQPSLILNYIIKT